MSAKKKAPAKLKSVSLKLPFMDAEWESDESELKVLMGLLNQLRSRRAMEVSRGMMAEQPVFFLDSIVQLRKEIRTLLNELPVKAHESRLIMLTVMDWLGEILDEWSRSMSQISPDAWDFRRLNMSDMRHIMQASWAVVEDVRKRMDILARDLERQLGIGDKTRSK